ncbi:unnamed protein product [Rangifer tarandus platyrhynchus]|uniref:Uncharacterized protein n=1 Tax=Rangifer tarandus platyrhynchus TaxID=3082113 RepID=A0AC59ZN04_RANTA
MCCNSSLSRPIQTAKVQVLRPVLKTLKKPLALSLHHQRCHPFCSARQGQGELFLSLPGPLSLQLRLLFSLLTAFPPRSEGETSLWCERSSPPWAGAEGRPQPALNAVPPRAPLPSRPSDVSVTVVLSCGTLPNPHPHHPGSQHTCHLTVGAHTARHPSASARCVAPTFHALPLFSAASYLLRKPPES